MRDAHGVPRRVAREIAQHLGASYAYEFLRAAAALEALAVRVALPNLRDEALYEIDDLLRRMNRAVDDTETWIARHDAFHDFMHESSGRPRLVAQIRQLRAAVQPYLRLYVEWKNNPTRHGFEHEAIAAAVVSGDAGKAEEIMHGHVMRAATKITEFLHTVRAGADAAPAPIPST